nr:SDR family oxidoreductase [uncultured Lichenicoccus sp.]
MTRTWFITGGSSGIGRALTERLLARGDRVAATFRRPGALDGLMARHGDLLRVAPLDVTDSAGIVRVMAWAAAELGRIDVVVSNAGYGLFGAAEEVSDAQIRRQIDTNLLGSIQVIRAALPHLREQGGGRILQVSSEGGQIAYPAFGLYHATKWGIEGFMEAVALEVAPLGIGCTIVEPGPTETGFRDGAIRAPAMAEYEDTPAGEIRRAVTSGAFKLPGDAGKVAQAMIDSVDVEPAPKRLLMGGGSWERVRAALVERLLQLDAQRELAYSTDRDT